MLVSTVLIRSNPPYVPKTKGTGLPYRPIKNLGHGCRVWSEKSLQNFYWLCDLGLSLSREYSRRYQKEHYCHQVIGWAEDNIPELPNLGLTPFYLAMPEELRGRDPVESYRNYYRRDKQSFAKWQHSETPYWWNI